MLSDAARKVVEYLLSREWPGAYATTMRKELAGCLGRGAVYGAIRELEDAGVVESTYSDSYGTRHPRVATGRVRIVRRVGQGSGGQGRLREVRGLLVRRPVNEPGWQLVAMHCSAGRRGIWVRHVVDGSIQLCAGREGDDCFIDLKPGDVLTPEKMSAIDDVVCSGTWALEVARDEVPDMHEDVKKWLDQEDRWFLSGGAWHREGETEGTTYCGLELPEDGWGYYDRGPLCARCEYQTASSEPYQLREFENWGGIGGVWEVRLLVRPDTLRAYVVLSTHDVARDRRIVELMAAVFGDLDYDLVPSGSEGMIPNDAEVVWRAPVVVRSGNGR